MGFKDEFKMTLKTRFLSGVLVIVPIFIAVAIIKFAVESIDNFIKPLVVKLLGEDYGFPFIGLAVTLMLIMLAGIFTTNVFGRKIYGLWEKLLLKIPLFRTIYSASKQLIEGMTVPDKKTFEKVVMVEYPRKGIFALGFLANRIRIHGSGGEREYWSIFIPTTPTPFSGVAILFPSDEPLILDMTVEQAIKFFVSGSVSSPDSMTVLKREDSVSDGNRVEMKQRSLKGIAE
jgi:uncharacterized membrane protein